MEDRYDIQEVKVAEVSQALGEIPEPPKKLWLRGEMPLYGTKFLTVVGSRALTRYGREACESLISGLAGYPISIISGLALGADACAHRAALLVGLHTIGIPGSGLSDDAISPRTNVPLAREILEHGGALLSEHPPDHIAYPHDFPSRNRIMVGMSDAVLVIEAGSKSGTLITARLAVDYNRDLLCVPHRIGDPNSYGCHQFLRLGATLVSESSHILEALGLNVAVTSSENVLLTLTAAERILYDLLEEPLPRDEVIRMSGMLPHVALTTLGIMEMNGVLKEEFGAWRRVI